MLTNACSRSSQQGKAGVGHHRHPEPGPLPSPLPRETGTREGDNIQHKSSHRKAVTKRRHDYNDKHSDAVDHTRLKPYNTLRLTRAVPARGEHHSTALLRCSVRLAHSNPTSRHPWLATDCRHSRWLPLTSHSARHEPVPVRGAGRPGSLRQ